ncbi:MAG: alpha-E domain-containing protein, partial [Alphaproteobacteria bacterium]
GQFSSTNVVDFMLRDRANPSSVASGIEAARANARLVRTALTREVWEATNVCWMALMDALARPMRESDLPDLLGLVRQQSALVRGAMHGTMLRNDGYNFAQLGTFLERADNTARILDVKYYVLLPSAFQVGSSLDNIQWETILRSVSAQRAYRWLNGGEANPIGIAEFLILNDQMPRALAFCYAKILDDLGHLAEQYGARTVCHDLAARIHARLQERPIQEIFDSGLHEFIQAFIRESNAVSAQLQIDYRFQG